MSARCTVPVVVNGEVVARFALVEDAVFFARCAVEARMVPEATVQSKDNDYHFTP